MKTLYNKLLSSFKTYAFSSSDELIKDVLVDVGRKRFKEKPATDEREPAYKFWYKLDEISKGFKFDSSCPGEFEEGSIELSKHELAEVKDVLIAEFMKYPYEEAIEQMVEAVYAWLLCCRMEEYKSTEETEQDAKYRYCLNWALVMGVV